MRGKKGWAGVISPDIRIHSIGQWGKPQKQSHTLKPGELAVAKVYPKIKLPTGQGFIPDISTRSIVARHGVDVSFHQGQIPEILQTRETPDEVRIHHKGIIPLKLRRGNRLHRVYMPLLPSVPRAEIMKLKKSGALVFGNDFIFRPNGLVEIKIQPVVYDLKTNPKIVAKTNWVSGSKRKEFMKHFKRAKKTFKTKSGAVVLTETKFVKLPKDVGLYLQSTVEDRPTSVHIKSLLIDPGFEGPIVLELFGLQKGKMPDRVLGWFVRPRT